MINLKRIHVYIKKFVFQVPITITPLTLSKLFIFLLSDLFHNRINLLTLNMTIFKNVKCKYGWNLFHKINLISLFYRLID